MRWPWTKKRVQANAAPQEGDTTTTGAATHRPRFFLVNAENEAHFSRLLPDTTNADIENRALVSAQLAPLYFNADHVENMLINYILAGKDVGYHTFLRLWEVFENVWLNHTGSDADRLDSIYNKITSTNIEIPILSIVPATIGFLLYWNELTEQRAKRTTVYQRKHIIEAAKKIGINETLDEAAYRAALQDLLDRGKVTLPEDSEAKNEAAQPNQKRKKKRLSPAAKSQRLDKKVLGAIYSASQVMWSYLVQTALLFWPAWMIAALVVGFAASYAFPVLPIVILASFATAALVKVVLHYMRKREAKKLATVKDPEKLKARAKHAEQAIARLSERVHMKKMHGYTKETFRAYMPHQEKPAVEKHSAYWVAETAHDHVMVLIKNDTCTPEQREKECAHTLSAEAMQMALQQSHVGAHLLKEQPSNRIQAGLNTVDSFIGNYTLSAFVCWVTGAAFLAIGLMTGLIPAAAGLTLVLLVVANVVLGAIFPGIAAAFNLLNGFLGGKATYEAVKKEQANRLKSAYLQLTAPYTPNNKEWVAKIGAWLVQENRATEVKQTVSQQEAFDFFYSTVEQKRAALAAALQAAQIAIKQKLKANPRCELTREERHLLNFQLIDVYKSRSLKEHEPTPSLMSKVREGCRYLFKGVNAGQTWIFVARSLFLMGAALAFLSLLGGPLAPFIFTAIAVTMCIAGVAIRLSKMRLEQKASDQQHFIDTMPDRISYLKKKCKELDGMKAYLDARAGNPLLGSTAQVLARSVSKNDLREAAEPEPALEVLPDVEQASVVGIANGRIGENIRRVNSVPSLFAVDSRSQATESQTARQWTVSV